MIFWKSGRSPQAVDPVKYTFRHCAGSLPRETERQREQQNKLLFKAVRDHSGKGLEGVLVSRPGVA